MDLKIKDVAELLNVSETTIRRWLGSGKIPAYRLNHQYRFNRIEIEDWVIAHKLGHNIHPFIEEQEPKSSVSRGSRQFSLYRAVHKGGVLHHVQGNTKEQLIRSVVKTIASDLNLDVDSITELLLEREAMQSTGLNHGIAIPHARDFLLKAPFNSVTVVFPETPLDYETIDGKPVNTLFFLFACDDRSHLHLLAKIAHLSSCHEALQLMQSQPEKNQLLEYIKAWEESISER